ncbi:MAG: chemotaxis protein CheX [Spirochaetia bacterium]|nr:chemotaxis protein CheX [Spirochaetia bacterium]
MEKIKTKVTDKMAAFLQMKEKGRLVLKEFVRSEVVNFNDKTKNINQYPLTYELDFFGSIEGNIYLNITSEAALHITKSLFGHYLNDNPENWKEVAMKEILNIFSGHIITAFDEYNYDLDMGTPSSSTHNFIESKPRKKILFRFLSNEHIIQFIVEVH